MNRLTYTIKAYSMLAKLIINGESMPFHSKHMSASETMKPENKKYLHNGKLRTAIMIAKGKCKLRWLQYT